MLARTITLAIAGAVLVSACSKSDPPSSSKARPSAAIVAPATPVPVPHSGEIDAALKERLARQEAAAKMFETKVLQPPAPRVPEPTPVTKPAPSTQGSRAEPAAAVMKPGAGAQSPPPQSPPVAATRAEPQKPVPAAPAPATAQIVSPPRTDLAVAAPSSAVPPASASPRLVSRVDPDFPREAVQAGADSGNVRARMTLDAAGSVTRVEIVESNPRRVFDRAVVRALSQWRYSDGTAGRTVDMEVAFKR